MFKDFMTLATHIAHRRKEEEAEQLAAQREAAQRRQAEKVVSGIYSFEPVNKEAAMLLARAPWFFHPPQGEPVLGKPQIRMETYEKEIRNARNRAKMRDVEVRNIPVCGKVKGTENHNAKQLRGHAAADADRRLSMSNGTRNGEWERGPNDDSPLLKGMKLKAINRDGECLYDPVDLAAEMVLAIQKNAPKEISDLVRIAIDARTALKESTDGMGEIITAFDRVTKSAQQDIRNTRMSIVAECSHMVNALKDVRQFFLGPDYERETKRLADFVDLCERLKRLKDSGFLDTVADTMLRLSSYESVQGST